jgi:cystine transport system substrate-binding protein
LLGPVALTVLLPASGAQRRGGAGDLRATEAKLSREAQRALLDLYSLEAALTRARARVATIAQRQATLEQQAEDMRRDLVGVTRSSANAQFQLQRQIRRLYEQPSPDPVAVVLGAQSLSEALASIDNLERVARQSSTIVHDTQATRKQLMQLMGRLAAQRRRLAALRDEAAVDEARLAAATGSRRAYVASLQRRKQVAASTLAALEHRASLAARSRVTRASATTVVVTAGAPDATPTPPDGAQPAGLHTLIVEATAYALPGTTATGLPVGHGVAAVDPSVIPLGTRFDVPGYGTAVAADVGSGIRGAEIDLWFPTDKEARAWGRRLVTITFK